MKRIKIDSIPYSYWRSYRRINEYRNFCTQSTSTNIGKEFDQFYNYYKDLGFNTPKDRFHTIPMSQIKQACIINIYYHFIINYILHKIINRFSFS